MRTEKITFKVARNLVACGLFDNMYYEEREELIIRNGELTGHSLTFCDCGCHDGNHWGVFNA